MIKTVSSTRKLKTAIHSLQTALTKGAEYRGNIEWAFPSGEKAVCETYTIDTALGEMLFGMPPPWNGRQAHLFALEYERGALHPDVEINISFELDRSVSGLFLESSKGLYLAHRGGVTSFRGKVPRHRTLNYFSEWLQPFDDEGRDATAIVITSMDSSAIGSEIAEFVFKVIEFKAWLKNSAENGQELETEIKPSADDDSPSQWNGADEFEGKKQFTPKGNEITYTYKHGPLCNLLKRRLSEILDGHAGFEVGKNKQIDIGIIDKVTNKPVAVFEVKTSASLSEQLYSAYGQLAYYKHRYGTQETKQFLVLPIELRNLFKNSEFFHSAGIQILFSSNEQIYTAEGAILDATVESITGGKNA
ncbi:hypothetical protein KW834_22910 [Pseudomonas sp. PDM29]|uniref:hypothetical protein n=1 Tax=Pseudomonas sp. PDM29 TaxID=2854771 RepID=UPI001C47EA71|nr:hypothetical protein [Pseudomonas sp. PDM29]MBV7527265.1 hypothetical protein [Pseudomonas sp. PDM29]